MRAKSLFSLVLVGALSFPALLQAETVVLERALPNPLPAPQEPTETVALVESGELPRVAERLPLVPLVVENTDYRQPGISGGELHMLVGRARDSRLLSVFGYARLVTYDENYQLVPDILQKVEIIDGRVFTLYLRPGHKWSDGEPFTTEDFRYFWEDIINNEELTPGGPPIELLVDGEPPTVEILGPTIVRYSWSKPNPFFLPALAATTPLYIYRPAHYLKKYHAAYADPAELAERVTEAEKENWAQLHNAKDNLYRMDNPNLPTLEPWNTITKKATERIEAVRNPYFHRIDSNGMQLPYIDKFVMNIVSSGLIPVKTGAGESDLQSRGINFSDYTFLKEGQKRNGYQVLLWDTVRGSELALYPNLNVKDPVWRALNRDVRFRRALSLAINRYEINQVVYYGLGQEGAQLVVKESPLYDEELAKHAYAEFDLAEANRLLDEIGLPRGDDGMRTLPDGRPLEIIVESAGENLEEPDVLELIADSWAEAGIKLFNKPSERTVLRNRIFAGETVMSIWYGYDNGAPTADWAPGEYTPVHQQSYQWPMWGQYVETKGESGEPVDLPEAQDLMNLYDSWRQTTDEAERAVIWKTILSIHADQVYTIGLVAGIPQPIVADARLRNLPQEKIFNWEPGAQLGMFRPDSFYWAPE